jgi:biopolymer transport protein ExbD
MPKFTPTYASAADDPIVGINTTPLIDVMLVLLIMFIITIPISTHKVPLDLPGEAPLQTEPVVHRLELDAAGRISLDGTPIAFADLRARLRAVGPGDDVSLRAEATTPYGRYDAVLAEIRRAGITRLGTVGNERFARALD